MENRTTTLAFTGHRVIPFDKLKEVRTRLESAILAKYHAGYRTFLSGMARGFDLLAAEAVLALRRTYPDIRLVAVIPYRAQPARFSSYDQRRYTDVLRQADRIDLLSEGYYDRCLLRRNDYLLSHSSAVIAYYDGLPSGGTCYTVRRAERAKMLIDNIY